MKKNKFLKLLDNRLIKHLENTSYLKFLKVQSIHKFIFITVETKMYIRLLKRWQWCYALNDISSSECYVISTKIF